MDGSDGDKLYSTTEAKIKLIKARSCQFPHISHR